MTQSSQHPNDVLTVREAAKRVHRAVGTVYAEIRADRFPHLHIGTGLVVPVKMFEAWLETGELPDLVTQTRTLRAVGGRQ